MNKSENQNLENQTQNLETPVKYKRTLVNYKDIKQKAMKLKTSFHESGNTYLNVLNSSYRHNGLLENDKLLFDFKFTDILKENISNAIETDINILKFKDNCSLTFHSFIYQHVDVKNRMGGVAYLGKKIHTYKDMNIIKSILTRGSKIFVDFEIVFCVSKIEETEIIKPKKNKKVEIILTEEIEPEFLVTVRFNVTYLEGMYCEPLVVKVRKPRKTITPIVNNNLEPVIINNVEPDIIKELIFDSPIITPVVTPKSSPKTATKTVKKTVTKINVIEEKE